MTLFAVLWSWVKSRQHPFCMESDISACVNAVQFPSLLILKADGIEAAATQSIEAPCNKPIIISPSKTTYRYSVGLYTRGLNEISPLSGRSVEMYVARHILKTCCYSISRRLINSRYFKSLGARIRELCCCHCFSFHSKDLGVDFCQESFFFIYIFFFL